jgi:hypothetical protein
MTLATTYMLHYYVPTCYTTCITPHTPPPMEPPMAAERRRTAGTGPPL